MITEVLAQLIAGGRLSAEKSEAVFEAIFRGELDAAQIGAFLALIQARTPEAQEIVGAARVMRRLATLVPVSDVGGPVLDTCGTGGAPKTFNISTVAAIVTAAAAPGKVRVAKHGNRSRTGRGSAEVLAALGVNIDAAPAIQARCLDELGVCFCFAIHHHPAAKHAGPVRKSLAVPTIFNLLGPLTNPAGARRQLLGIYDENLVGLMAEALVGLGAERALVVHGLDGMDEISTTAPTRMATVENGAVSSSLFDSTSVGIARATLDDLRASSLEEAAAIACRVLENQPGPARDIVALNAGAALWVAGAAPDIGSGINLAQEAIESGAARTTLDRLGSLSHS